MALRGTFGSDDGITLFVPDERLKRCPSYMQEGKIPFVNRHFYVFSKAKRDEYMRETVITHPELLARIAADDKSAAVRAPLLAQLRKELKEAP